VAGCGWVRFARFSVSSSVLKIRNGLLGVRMVIPKIRNGLLDVRMVIPKTRNGLLGVRMVTPKIRNGLLGVRMVIPKIRNDLPNAWKAITIIENRLPWAQTGGASGECGYSMVMAGRSWAWADWAAVGVRAWMRRRRSPRWMWVPVLAMWSRPTQALRIH